jgi:hypothetical protein
LLLHINRFLTSQHSTHQLQQTFPAQPCRLSRAPDAITRTCNIWHHVMPCHTHKRHPRLHTVLPCCCCWCCCQVAC